MHALTRFLFPAPAPRTVGGILAWWERRRPAYNLIVGGAGVVSLLGFVPLVALTGEGFPPLGFLWPPIVAVGLAANLFYCLGPAMEIAATKVWGDELLPPGPVLYRMGLTFSVGLMFVPLMMVLLVWVARIIGWMI